MQGSSPEEFQEAMISLRRPEVLAIGFDWTVLTCPHWFSTSSTHQHRALVGKLALRHCMPQLQAHRDTGYAEICHWETNHTLLGCQAWAEDLRQLKSTQFCRQLIHLLLKAGVVPIHLTKVAKKVHAECMPHLMSPDSQGRRHIEGILLIQIDHLIYREG